MPCHPVWLMKILIFCLNIQWKYINNNNNNINNTIIWKPNSNANNNNNNNNQYPINV